MVVVVVVKTGSEDLHGGVNTWERYRRCGSNLGLWIESVLELICSAD